jgi:protein TonB
MRLGLLLSLLVHTGAVVAAWALSAPRTEAREAVAGVYLHIAPRVRPERPPSPPAELRPSAVPPDPPPVVPAEEPPEPIESRQTVTEAPRPFRLRAVAKLATPLPVRRATTTPPSTPTPPAAAKPEPRRGVREGTVVAPRLVDTPAVPYPVRARRLGWEGRVVLELVVSARGTVEKVTIATSSGHRVLDRAAAAAARHWRFRPATRGGRPIAHTVRVPVDFALD